MFFGGDRGVPGRRLFTYLGCDDEGTEVDRSFNGEGHCGRGVFGGHVKVGFLIDGFIRGFCDKKSGKLTAKWSLRVQRVWRFRSGSVIVYGRSSGSRTSSIQLHLIQRNSTSFVYEELPIQYRQWVSLIIRIREFHILHTSNLPHPAWQ